MFIDVQVDVTSFKEHRVAKDSTQRSCSSC